jgi:hypothetical protein
VVAGVGDSLDADQLAGIGRASAGDTADHREAPAQLREDSSGALGNGDLLGVLRDRRQGAVDVGEHRGRGRIVEQRRDQRVELLVGGGGWHRHSFASPGRQRAISSTHPAQCGL